MKLETHKSVDCEHLKAIDNLKKIIAIDCSLNIVKIDCAHALLRWSASPNICIKRHNVVISSLCSSILVSKMANVSLICSSVTGPELMKTITELTIKKPLMCINTGKNPVLKEDELDLYHDLFSSRENIGKYRSNKKKRMMDRIGLKGDYEYVIFFNLIYSMPYQLLRVKFIQTQEESNQEKIKLDSQCRSLACKAININASNKSFLLCATVGC